MKVLRVINTMDPSYGGPCQGIRNSIPELLKNGVVNEVVCMDDPNASFLNRDSFMIHAVGAGRGAWSFNENLMPWLLENMGRFDVIIIHGLWLYHSYATMNVLKKLKKSTIVAVPKVYIMPHGMLDPYFQRAANRKIKAYRNYLYWNFIESRNVNNADGILFTCQSELQLARLTFRKYYPKKELNVGYGIQFPPAYKKSMSLEFENKCKDLDKPYILFLSRIHEKKGVDILIEAYMRVKEENYILPILVIAGPGLDTSYGKKIQIMAAADQDIIFVGMLTGEAKWGAFYGCSAFILPSHQENFGISVVEALACGKPVLISDQVNIWQEIIKYGAGEVTEDTVNGVVKILKRWVAKDINELREVEMNAKKAFLDSFTISKAATQFISSIKQ